MPISAIRSKLSFILLLEQYLVLETDLEWSFFRVMVGVYIHEILAHGAVVSLCIESPARILGVLEMRKVIWWTQ